MTPKNQTSQQIQTSNQTTSQNSTNPTVPTQKDLVDNLGVSTTEKPKEQFLGFLPRVGKGAIITKIGFFSGIFLLGILLISLITFFTGVDTQFVGITLEGSVVDEEGAALSEVQILVDNFAIGTTDEDGRFTLHDVDPGKVNITLVANGYERETTQVAIGRGLLDYTIEKKFVLKSAAEASLSGRFVAPDNENYSFEDDQFFIAEKEYEIARDGSVSIPDIFAGEVTFAYKSPNYTDFERKAEIVGGENVLADIILEPAGDVSGSLESHVREDIPEEFEILVEAVSEGQIEVSNREFYIRDLEIGRTYNIRFEAIGFETRDYSVTVEQGETILTEFAVVEAGDALFLQQVARDEFEIFSSNFDGEDLEQLTALELNPSNAEFVPEENTVYFTSTSDRIRSENGGLVAAPYKFNLDTRQAESLLQTEDNLGQFYPNFESGSMLHVVESVSSWQVELSNFAATERTEFYSTSNEILGAALATNTDVAAIVESTGESTKLTVFNPNSGEERGSTTRKNIEIVDISDNGQAILFSAENTSNNFRDLLVYYVRSNEVRALQTNFDGRLFQFLDGSDNDILFTKRNVGRDGLYVLNIEEATESAILNLPSSIEVEILYQQSGLIFYASEDTLYVVDISNDNAHAGKVVVEGEFRGIE